MSAKETLIPDPKLEKGPWRRDHIWVSQYNFAPELEKERVRPAEVIVHDSTLRDGEQAHGVSFNTEEKVTIARLLNEVGVQHIEAGFPPVSVQDRESMEKWREKYPK